MSEEKDLNYWKANAEEDYKQVPISVLRYISELEKATQTTTELDLANVSESSIHEIRNKLQSITTMIDMVDRGELEYAKKCVDTAKKAVNHLARREVYSH